MLPNEKEIPNYPNYTIDTNGIVRSYFYNKVKVIKLEILRNGYHRVSLTNQHKAKKILVSQLVLETFVGPRPLSLQACHGPKGKNINSLDNLYWDTPSNNCGRDRIRDNKFVKAKGQSNPNAKLNESQVKEILSLLGKENQSSIAKRYGVTITAINLIATGKSWKHIERTKKWEKRKKRLLTKEQVNDIIELSKTQSKQSIANKYNLHKTTVYRVISKRKET